MNQVLGEEEKNKIYDDLADIVIDALGKGLISHEEAVKSAKYILDSLDKIKTQFDLSSFFENLCRQWQIYQPVYIKFKSQLIKKTDEIKMVEITKKLNQLIQNQNA